MLETFDEEISPLPQGALHLCMQYSTSRKHPEATATITYDGKPFKGELFSEKALRFTHSVPPIIVERPNPNTLVIKGNSLDLSRPVFEDRGLIHSDYNLYRTSLNIINEAQKEASLQSFSIPYTYQGQNGHLDVSVEMGTRHGDIDKGLILVTMNIRQMKDWRKSKTFVNDLPIMEDLPEAEITAQQHAAIVVTSQLFSQYTPHFTGNRDDKYHLAHFNVWNGGGQKYIDMRPTSPTVGLQKLYVDVKDYLTQMQKTGIVIGGHAEKVRKPEEEPLGQQIADVLHQFKGTVDDNTRTAIRQALEKKLGGRGLG